MIKIRPSVVKMNARYRGPTDTETYVNVFNEILHDIKRLYHVSTESKMRAGHRNNISDNLLAAVDGNKLLSSQPLTGVIPMTNIIDSSTTIDKNLAALQKELIEWNL